MLNDFWYSHECAEICRMLGQVRKLHYQMSEQGGVPKPMLDGLYHARAGLEYALLSIQFQPAPASRKPKAYRRSRKLLGMGR